MKSPALAALALAMLTVSLAAAVTSGTEPPAWKDQVTGVEFVSIPGGDFLMGSAEGRPDERPVHKVTLPSFSLSRLEVTQRQWGTVMGTSPSRFAGCQECPVEQVSWHDVQTFLTKARALTGLPLRLPTEAEWEYAAGGGGAERQRWPGTSLRAEAGEFAWYSGNFSGRTRPGGRKIPNLFGLHDMAGNVAEWCSDWYGADYYSRSPEQAPRGPATGRRRVVRGGSWLSGPGDITVTRRSRRSPETSSPSLGFRLAADVPPPP